MTAMTSSMSTIATSRPCTRCSRSSRRRRRYSRAPAHDLEAVLDVHLQQLAQPERARLALDEGHVVDAERVLHRRLRVQLLEHRLGQEPALDLDDQAEPGSLSVRSMTLVMPCSRLAFTSLLDPLDDPLGPDARRQLGDDDALAPRADVLDLGGGADPERAATGLVRLADPVQPDDPAAARAGPGPGRTASASSSVAPGCASRWRAAATTSTRLCGGMLVAIPTAMPEAPLTSRFGNAAGQHRRLGLAAVVVRRRSRRRPRRCSSSSAARRPPAGTRCSAWPPARRRGSRSCRARRPAAPASRTAGPCAPARRRSRRRRAGGACPSPRRRRARS